MTRCTNCDRADCPKIAARARLAAIETEQSAIMATLRPGTFLDAALRRRMDETWEEMKPARADLYLAHVDCGGHRVDWRARALLAESTIAAFRAAASRCPDCQSPRGDTHGPDCAGSNP